MKVVRKTPEFSKKVKISCIYKFLVVGNPQKLVPFLTVKEKSWSERYQASNESDRTYSEWQLAYKEWERVDSEIKKLPKIDSIIHLPIDKNQIQNLIDAYQLNEKRACAESQRNMGYATAAASLEKYLWKKVEVDMISEMYERHRVELGRVRSERQRYQTEYLHLQKEEMDRLAARIVNYQQDRHEWTKEEQDKLDMKRRIALMTKTSSDQQERCQIEMERLRCENEKVKDKYNSSQTDLVRITQKLEQEEQDKEKLKVKFQESSQASQKELDRLVEEREKLAKEILTTKTENERLRKELESSQQGAKEEVIKLQNIIVSMQNELDRLNVEWEKTLSAYIMSHGKEAAVRD
ncbi:flagellar attachment zone protein 1-like [Daphnia pulex]|uniref:flagellar attachment zone protein 1-like n=1 Tax=Daphnia pulex TaxID=6669 RepID=UPI001EDE1274|nr:flagellar attachment zone protein 1-like [Daphnia pulex]